jgi:hypothetical protein
LAILTFLTGSVRSAATNRATRKKTKKVLTDTAGLPIDNPHGWRARGWPIWYGAGIACASSFTVVIICSGKVSPICRNIPADSTDDNSHNDGRPRSE